MLAVLVFAPATVTRAGQELAWTAASLPGGDQPFDVVALDLDGDGDADLAVTDSKDSTVSVFLGNGDGTFAPRTTFPTGPFPRGLVAADFNRDGKPDLAVASKNGHAVFVHDGLGTGAFAAGRRFPTGRRLFMAAAADFNRDGNPDIAVANEHRDVSILLGNGTGGFRVHRYAVGKWPSAVAAADWNGDGHLDFASTNWGHNTVTVRFGAGDGIDFPERRDFTYEPTRTALEARGHGLFGILAADLDRDGHTDMVWNDLMRSAFWIVYGNGRGRFPRTALVPAGPGIRSMRAADLDGDGWLDLASANTASGSSAIARADGRGGFEPTQFVPVGVKPRVVEAADFNRDGRLDLVTTNMDSDSLTILTNRGLLPRSAAFDPGPQQHGRMLEFAGLLGPHSAVIDRTGDLLVSDQRHHRIVRLRLPSPASRAGEGRGEGTSATPQSVPSPPRSAEEAAGGLVLVAGTGQADFRGDGGPAVEASFRQPAGLALDAQGNLYIADFDNHRIRKVDPAGLVATVAGTGTAGFAGDGGPAVDAELYRPLSLALAPSGALYVADLLNFRIRKIDPSGVITTVAGTGRFGLSGDGGPGTAADLGPVLAIAADRRGNLYIADQLNRRIRKLDSNGTITTVAGTAAGAADDIGQPSAIAVGPDDTVYFATSSRIAKLGTGGRAETVADFAADAAAVKGAPSGLAVDANGIVFATDSGGGAVVRIARDGTIARVVNDAAAHAETPAAAPGRTR